MKLSHNYAHVKAQLTRDLSFQKAVVLLSGGQDSMTVLHYAIGRHGVDNVDTISADYGQRHAVELGQAAQLAADLGVGHRVLDLSVLGKLVKSNLTVQGRDPDTDQMFQEKHGRLTELPSSFVPARNAMLLTLAHAYAAEIGAEYVYGGMCQTDYSGYPDCRSPFIMKLETALNLGYEVDITFVMPLMNLTKGETFQLAADLGILDLILEESRTCYNGDTSLRHPWGYGCGHCPACLVRAKGWEDFTA